QLPTRRGSSGSGRRQALACMTRCVSVAGPVGVGTTSAVRHARYVGNDEVDGRHPPIAFELVPKRAFAAGVAIVDELACLRAHDRDIVAVDVVRASLLREV